MPYMELRSTFTTCFFLFIVLAFPYFSRGGSRSEALDSEMYEIDYRGPETHASVPPPQRSHGKPHSTHRKSSADAAKSAVLMGTTTHKGKKVKEVHV